MSKEGEGTCSVLPGRSPSRTGSPTPNRQGPKTRRSTFTSNFANGADNHGPVVGGSKHVAVAGAVALLCVRQGYGHPGLGLGPRATHQVPLQQLGAGQDDAVVGERDSQPGRERSRSLESCPGPEGGAAPAEMGRGGEKRGQGGERSGGGCIRCRGRQRLGAPLLGSPREACRGTGAGKGFASAAWGRIREDPAAGEGNLKLGLTFYLRSNKLAPTRWLKRTHIYVLRSVGQKLCGSG